MNVRFVSALLGLAAAGCATPRPSDPAEDREVVRTVERLFEGMRTQDTAVLSGLLAPELVFVSARDTAGYWRVTHYTAREFLSGMAEPVDTATQFRERMWNHPGQLRWPRLSYGKKARQRQIMAIPILASTRQTRILTG